MRGIGVSGSGYNEVLALEVLNVIDCVEQKRRADLTASASTLRALYIYVHACMYMYMYAFIHMCMCMCTHICA